MRHKHQEANANMAVTLIRAERYVSQSDEARIFSLPVPEECGSCGFGSCLSRTLRGSLAEP